MSTPTNRLSIFISHPSDFLTNCQIHGDGLAAFEFISRLAKRGHTLHVAVPALDIEGELPGNIKLYSANIRTPFETLYSIEYAIEVRRIFNNVRRQFEIDIIHQLNPVNRGLSITLINTGVPIVLGLFVPDFLTGLGSESLRMPFTLGTISYSLIRPFIGFCDRLLQRKAAALVLANTAALSRLYEPETVKDRISFLPFGVDTAQFSPCDSNGKSGQELSILYLARLNYQKGIFTLLDAFERVVTKFPSCHLNIAGSGPDLEQLKLRISHMSCKSNISLLGAISRKYVPELMRQCTVYCLPSYGEPFGISALEAMACGKPVVCTNTGGLAYLVPDRGGRKVLPGDSPALAQALLEILTSVDLQMTMGRYNRQLVEENYSWDKVIEKLESIYYSIKASVNL